MRGTSPRATYFSVKLWETCEPCGIRRSTTCLPARARSASLSCTLLRRNPTPRRRRCATSDVRQSRSSSSRLFRPRRRERRTANNRTRRPLRVPAARDFPAIPAPCRTSNRNGSPREIPQGPEFLNPATYFPRAFLISSHVGMTSLPVRVTISVEIT